MSESLELRLLFDDHLVGTVRDAYFSDNTWFGEFEPAATLYSDPLLQRIRDYYEFSKSWHERFHAGAEPAPAEFRAFRSVTESKKWRADAIVLGESIELHGAPAFWEDGFTSFAIRECRE